jgi:hypothetical protein
MLNFQARPTCSQIAPHSGQGHSCGLLLSWFRLALPPPPAALGSTAAIRGRCPRALLAAARRLPIPPVGAEQTRPGNNLRKNQKQGNHTKEFFAYTVRFLHMGILLQMKLTAGCQIFMRLPCK